MEQQVKLPEFFLQEKRLFKASKAALFKAWTDADALKKWFGPEGVTIESVEVDLSVGGEYSFGMKPENSPLFYHRGNYLEIVDNEKLVFSWLLEGQDCDGCSGEHGVTIVTLEFLEKDGMTELVLSHEKLPSEESRANHSLGWSGCLDSLGEYL